MSSDQITIFIFSIGLLLILAKLLGELFNKINQPAVIGEILAGILLGPTVFGMISPETFHTLFPATGELRIALDGITTIAVVLLLLVSGLEVDLSTVLRQRKTAISTGLLGIVFPFSLGFSVAYFFPQLMGVEDDGSHFVFALFMGTALSISALPVIAKTLMDLNIFKTEIGFIIISAAMFNDLVGWLIFSLILGMIGEQSHGMGFLSTVAITFAFLIIVLLLGRKLFNKILPWIQNKLSFPGAVLNFIIIAGLMGAAFTEFIGIHAIFGAFIVGIAIGDSVHLKERTRELIQQFITNIFAPLFFATIGLRVNFITNFDLSITVIILILAFSGKILGCGYGAYISGMSKNESIAVGFGMNSRGAMEIILGLLALQYGLINENIFVALVFMALLTSMTSAPFMNYFLTKRDKLNLDSLLIRRHFFFSNANSKKDVLSELLKLAAAESRLNDQVTCLYDSEEFLTSGLVNYLAIPHARIKSNSPLIITAYNADGFNFDSNDGLPSKIIMLLLTPENKNELQLQLLSEISKKFRNKAQIEFLFEKTNEDEFFTALKNL
jgi:Kef-type K+ transport system membrane component KefB/mannitol/fructose-specific phosphotransferase system IIA component (Ntr-type)